MKTKENKELTEKLYQKIREIRIMNREEQYQKLKTIRVELAYFNKYGEVTLQQDDLEVLKELYKVYFPAFTRLNTTCSNCVKEMLNVCISRYSSLEQEFAPKELTITNDDPAMDNKIEPVKEEKVEIKKVRRKK